jgi:predicted MPP superfamily phosphohydrolase
MKITRYKLETDKRGIDVRLAVVSDLHARPYKKIIRALESISPDAILLPGDIVEIAAEYMDERNQNGLMFLKEAANIAPCYYCFGNHEIYYSHAKGGKTKTPEKTLSEEYMKKILSYGVHVINDSYELFSLGPTENVIRIGGLVCGRDMDPVLDMKAPDLNFLNEFNSKAGYNILLCHYPHYYEKYLKQSDIDLVLSGHAHGGQFRLPLIGGLYAPGQGAFPAYDSGVYTYQNANMVVSRGIGQSSFPLRFNNRPELVIITLGGTD